MQISNQNFIRKNIAERTFKVNPIDLSCGENFKNLEKLTDSYKLSDLQILDQKFHSEIINQFPDFQDYTTILKSEEQQQKLAIYLNGIQDLILNQSYNQEISFNELEQYHFYLQLLTETILKNNKYFKRELINLKPDIFQLTFKDTDADKNTISFNPEKEGYVLYSLNGKRKEYARELSIQTIQGKFNISSMVGTIPQQTRAQCIEYITQIMFLADCTIIIDDVQKQFTDIKIIQNQELLCNKKLIEVIDKYNNLQKQVQNDKNLSEKEIQNMIKMQEGILQYLIFIQQITQNLDSTEIQIQIKKSLQFTTKFGFLKDSLLEQNNIEQYQIQLLKSNIFSQIYTLQYLVFKGYQSNQDQDQLKDIEGDQKEEQKEIENIETDKQFQKVYSIHFIQFLNLFTYALNTSTSKDEIINYLNVLGQIYHVMEKYGQMNEKWKNQVFKNWNKLFDLKNVLPILFEKSDLQQDKLQFFEKILHLILVFIEKVDPQEYLFPLRANKGKKLWNIIFRINAHIFETEKQIQSLLDFYKRYYILSKNSQKNENQLTVNSYISNENYIQLCEKCDNNKQNLQFSEVESYNCAKCKKILPKLIYIKCKQDTCYSLNVTELTEEKINKQIFSQLCIKCNTFQNFNLEEDQIDDCLIIKCIKCKEAQEITEENYQCNYCENQEVDDEISYQPHTYKTITCDDQNCGFNQNQFCIECLSIPLCQCSKFLDIVYNPMQNIQEQFECHDCKENFQKMPAFYCKKDKYIKCLFCWQQRQMKTAKLDLKCLNPGCDKILEFMNPKYKEWVCDICEMVGRKPKTFHCKYCSKDMCQDCIQPILQNFLKNQNMIDSKKIVLNEEFLIQNNEKIMENYFNNLGEKPTDFLNFNADLLKNKMREQVNNQLRIDIAKKSGVKNYPSFVEEVVLLAQIQMIQIPLLFNQNKSIKQNDQNQEQFKYSLYQTFEMLEYYFKQYNAEEISSQIPIIINHLFFIKQFDECKTQEERIEMLNSLKDNKERFLQLIEYQKFIQILLIVDYLLQNRYQNDQLKISDQIIFTLMDYVQKFQYQQQSLLIQILKKLGDETGEKLEKNEQILQVYYQGQNKITLISQTVNIMKSISSNLKQAIQEQLRIRKNSQQQMNALSQKLLNSSKDGETQQRLQVFRNLKQLYNEKINEDNSKDYKSIEKVNFCKLSLFIELFSIFRTDYQFFIHLFFSFSPETLNHEMFSTIIFYLKNIKKYLMEQPELTLNIMKQQEFISIKYLVDILNSNFIVTSQNVNKFQSESDRKTFKEIIDIEEQFYNKNNIKLEEQQQYLQVLSQEGQLKLNTYIRPYIYKIYIAIFDLYIYEVEKMNFKKQYDFEQILINSQYGLNICEYKQQFLVHQISSDLFKNVEDDKKYKTLQDLQNQEESIQESLIIQNDDPDFPKPIPSKNVIYLSIGQTELLFDPFADYKGREVVQINASEDTIDLETLKKSEYDARQKIQKEMQINQITTNFRKTENELGQWIIYFNDFGIHFQILSKNPDTGMTKFLNFLKNVSGELLNNELIEFQESSNKQEQQKALLTKLIDEFNKKEEEKVESQDNDEGSKENLDKEIEQINQELQQKEKLQKQLQKQENIQKLEFQETVDKINLMQTMQNMRQSIDIIIPPLKKIISNIKKENQDKQNYNIQDNEENQILGVKKKDNILIQFNQNPSITSEIQIKGEPIFAQTNYKQNSDLNSNYNNKIALASRQCESIYIMDEKGQLLMQQTLSSENFKTIQNISFDKDGKTLCIYQKECSYFYLWDIETDIPEFENGQLNKIQLETELKDDYITISKWSKIHNVIFFGTNHGWQIFFDKTTQKQSKLKELSKFIDSADWNYEGQIFMIGSQEKRFSYTNYKGEKIWISNKTRDFNNIQYAGKKDDNIIYFGTTVKSDNQLKFLHFKGASYKQELLSSVEFNPKYGQIKQFQMLKNNKVITSLSKGYLVISNVEKKETKEILAAQVCESSIDYFQIDEKQQKVVVCSGNNICKILELDTLKEIQTLKIDTQYQEDSNQSSDQTTNNVSFSADAKYIYRSTNNCFQILLSSYQTHYTPKICQDYIFKWLARQYIQSGSQIFKNNTNQEQIQAQVQEKDKDEIDINDNEIQDQKCQKIMNNLLLKEIYKRCRENDNQSEQEIYNNLINQNEFKYSQMQQSVYAFFVTQSILYEFCITEPLYVITSEDSINLHIEVQQKLIQNIQQIKQQEEQQNNKQFKKQWIASYFKFLQLNLNQHIIEMFAQLNPQPEYLKQSQIPKYQLFWVSSKNKQICKKKQFSSIKDLEEKQKYLINKKYQFLVVNKYQKQPLLFQQQPVGEFLDNIVNKFIEEQKEILQGQEKQLMIYQEVMQIKKIQEKPIDFDPQELYYKLVNLFSLHIPLIDQIASENSELLKEKIKIECQNQEFTLENMINQIIFITTSLLLTQEEIQNKDLEYHVKFLEMFPSITDSSFSVCISQLIHFFIQQDSSSDYIQANQELLLKKKINISTKTLLQLSYPKQICQITFKQNLYEYQHLIEQKKQQKNQYIKKYEDPKKQPEFYETLISVNEMPQTSDNTHFVINYLIENFIQSIYKIQVKKQEKVLNLQIITSQLLSLIEFYPLICPEILKYKLKQDFKNEFFDIPEGTSFFKFLIIITPMSHNLNKEILNSLQNSNFFYENRRVLREKNKQQNQEKEEKQKSQENIEENQQDEEENETDDDDYNKCYSSRTYLKKKIFAELYNQTLQIIEKKVYGPKEIIFLKGYFCYLQPNAQVPTQNSQENILYYKRVIKIYEKLLEEYFLQPNEEKDLFLQKLNFISPQDSFLKALFDILLDLKRAVFKTKQDTTGIGHQFLYYYYQKNIIQWLNEMSVERENLESSTIIENLQKKLQKNQEEEFVFDDDHPTIKKFGKNLKQIHYTKKMKKKLNKLEQIDNKAWFIDQASRNISDMQQTITMSYQKEEFQNLFKNELEKAETKDKIQQEIQKFEFEKKVVYTEVKKIFPESTLNSLIRSKSNKLKNEDSILYVPIYLMQLFEEQLKILDHLEEEQQDIFNNDNSNQEIQEISILGDRKIDDLNNYSFSYSDYSFSQEEDNLKEDQEQQNLLTQLNNKKATILEKGLQQLNTQIFQNKDNLKKSQFSQPKQVSLQEQQDDQDQFEDEQNKNTPVITQDLSKILVQQRQLSKSEIAKLQILKIQEKYLLKNFNNIDEQNCKINDWQKTDFDLSFKDKRTCRNLIYSPDITKEDQIYLIKKLDPNILSQIDPSKLSYQQLQQFDQVSIPSDISDGLSDLPSLQELCSSDIEDSNYNPVLKFKEELKENIPELEKSFNKDFFDQFPLFSDNALSALIILLFKDQLQFDVQRQLCMHPLNCYRIYDATSFLLQFTKNDAKILQENNELNFGQFYQETLEDQQFTKQFTEFYFKKDNLFEKQKRKFGYAFIFRSIFSKNKKLILLDNDYQHDKEHQEKLYKPLPIIENARQILLQNQDEEEKLKQQQDIHCFLSIASQNIQLLNHEIDCNSFFKECSQQIKVVDPEHRNYKYPQDEEKDLQKMIYEPESNIWEILDMYKKQQNKKKPTEMVYFPEINYYYMFQNHPIIFKQICAGSLVKQEQIKPIIYQALKFTPSLFQLVIEGFFTNVSYIGNQQMQTVLEKCSGFITEFSQNYPNIQRDKPLEKQMNNKKFQETLRKFMEFLADKQLQYQLQYILMFSMYLQQIYSEIIMIQVLRISKTNKERKMVTQSIKRLEKEKLEVLTQEQIITQQQQNYSQKKLSQQQKKIELKKKKITQQMQKLYTKLAQNKNQVLGKLQESIQKILHKIPDLSQFYRHLIEAQYLLVDFIGDPTQITFNYLEDGIKSFIILGLTTNLQEEQFQNEDEFESEDDVFLDPTFIPVPKLLSKEASLTARKSNPNIFANQNNMRKLISHSKSMTITLQSTFSMLFGRIYPVIENIDLQSKFESQMFKLAIQHSNQFMSFKKKLSYLKVQSIKKAKMMDPKVKESKHYNTIDRASPWVSSIQNIFYKYTNAEIIVHDVRVKFEGEPGEDWGGLRNEWLAMITNEVFNPQFGLFALSANRLSILPSPYAYLVPDYLTHFKMLGKLVGKALIQNWQLQLSFSKTFLKLVLGKTLYIQDLEDVDPEFSRNLEYILDNDIGDDLGITFTHPISIFGACKYIQLEENGNDLEVTENNKKQYVKASAKANLIDSIQKQTQAFRQGLYEIIPQKALQCVNENELGLHLSGMPTLNIKELQQYCTLKAGFQRTDPTIIYFFEILEEFDDIMKANLLFFFTGAFKIPVDGFKNNPLMLSKVNNKNKLPVAHTCFNQIDLPDYENKELLREKLLTAILEGHSGFHIE